jgi:hypothetical protein
MTFHNSALARLVPDGGYPTADLARIEAALKEHPHTDVVPEQIARRLEMFVIGRKG